MVKQTKHLTQGHTDEMASKIARTPKGMAHWAGTGPNGKTCGQCSEHKTLQMDGKTYKSGLTESHHCQRTLRTMQRKTAGRVPGTTAACRFFVERIPE